LATREADVVNGYGVGVVRSEDQQADGVTTALNPAFSPKEKEQWFPRWD